MPVQDMTHNIRQVQAQDVAALKTVIDTSGLFPPELLDGMLADYFTNPGTTDVWLTLEQDGIPVAVTYCAPERLTEGTYNLYLIAVHSSRQGKGLGAILVGHIERMLAKQGHRVLLVETSGLEEYELTRKFYDKCGYHREAVIRDFYREGEDKIVFWKKLQG
jgi:ribosomal protein S18 acetylase RimI-like enzyme